MAAEEDHVLESVQTHRAHRLLLDISQLLLQLLHVPHVGVPGPVVHHRGVPGAGADVVDGLTGQRGDGGVLDWAGVVLIAGSGPVRERWPASCPLHHSRAVVDNLPVLVS